MRRIVQLSLAFLVAACGEPIEPPKKETDATKRTLPVVATGRVDQVGEAFKVSITMTRAAQGLTSRQQYVDVLTEVVDGRRTVWDRHGADGKVHRIEGYHAERSDFATYEQFLPRRGGDVPEAWRVENVLGALHDATILREMPRSGGSADCRIESVQVGPGRSRAVIRVEFRAEGSNGPIVLSGRLEQDLKHKMLALVELDGSVGAEKISIRGTRMTTNFVPPKR